MVTAKQMPLKRCHELSNSLGISLSKKINFGRKFCQHFFLTIVPELDSIIECRRSSSVAGHNLRHYAGQNALVVPQIGIEITGLKNGCFVGVGLTNRTW